MNKIVLLGLLFSLFTVSGTFAQGNDNNASKLSPEEVATYEKQSRQLVGFMEFAFNTLGSDKVEYKDKHTIIEQSFLKFFKDEKVQIEDDLVEKRDMVTNKDVQAYLKDIDFFYKTVTFKYTIEEITQEVGENGEVFFKVKASRNIKGTTLKGKQINENRIRFIELNLDGSNRDLKIVSVYTTKSNEVQELIAWWNELTPGWRTFFAQNTQINDTTYLKDVVVIHNDYVIKETVYSGYQDSLVMADTIFINESKVLPELRRILRADQLSIADASNIYDLKPLYAFSLLKHLDVSNARIPDLEPIRNLSKLETLIARKSLINSIEPIRYIPGIRILDISGTLVSDIKPLESYEALEVLNLSESRVDSIQVLKNLTKLRELNLSSLLLKSLEPIKSLQALEVLELSKIPLDTLDVLQNLINLKRLVVDQTLITNLEDLKELKNLEFLFIDNTPVRSLKPLESLSGLKMVYCDKTFVSKEDALAFMQLRPDVKVIYESQELMAWWESMSPDWRKVFGGLVELSETPTREELHEVSYIKNLSISGNKSINNILPLVKLAALNSLDLSNSKIADLQPIANLFDLQSLDISNSEVSDLSPISKITSLKEIKLSNTPVTSIKPISSLPDLRLIQMDSVNVSDAELLAKMKRLNIIYADGVGTMPQHVNAIWESLPDVLVIYQSKFLADWFSSLSTEWKSFLSSKEIVNDNPDRVQLHKVATMKEIDLSNAKDIRNLDPLSVFQRLETLKIASLQISDLNTLNSITKLQTVDISNTPVQDISSLSNHKMLRHLNCANTPVSDISPIAGLATLVKLNISGTQVKKLDPLENCVNLVELDCFNTRINNLKPLDELKNIKLLRIYNTKLSQKKIDKFKELHPTAEVVYY